MLLPYQRILLKLSGEVLMGQLSAGIDPQQLAYYAEEIAKVKRLGVELAIVIGGGNLYRGVQALGLGIARVQGDYMGMLATVMNGLALQSALEHRGISTRLMAGLAMEQVCETYIHAKAIRQLEKGRVVILVAGMGRPYCTTDSAASLRAIELGADVLLKATKVDGIYTDDPSDNPAAVRLEGITFQEVYQQKLQVMDMTAFTLCEENNLPIIVFDSSRPDNLLKLVQREKVGTLVSREK